MEKIIKTIDIANTVFVDENKASSTLSNTEKVLLIRQIFDLINSEVSNMNEGKLKVQGLGNFIIRNVPNADSSGITRRVVFKGKEN